MPLGETWRLTSVSLRGADGLLFRVEVDAVSSSPLLQSPEFDLATDIVLTGGAVLLFENTNLDWLAERNAFFTAVTI